MQPLEGQRPRTTHKELYEQKCEELANEVNTQVAATKLELEAAHQTAVNEAINKNRQRTYENSTQREPSQFELIENPLQRGRGRGRGNKAHIVQQPQIHEAHMEHEVHMEEVEQIEHEAHMEHEGHMEEVEAVAHIEPVARNQPRRAVQRARGYWATM
ncbi:MAG: hypothetical protein Q9214_004526 [Letrouitia sp. 1 TL-2023]